MQQAGLVKLSYRRAQLFTFNIATIVCGGEERKGGGVRGTSGASTVTNGSWHRTPTTVPLNNS